MDTKQNITYYTEGFGFAEKQNDSIMYDPYLLFSCHFSLQEKSNNGYFIPRNNIIKDIIVFGVLYEFEKYKIYMQKNVLSGKSRFIILYKQPISKSDFASEEKKMEKMMPMMPKDGRISNVYVEMNIDGVKIKPFRVLALHNDNFKKDNIIKSINEALRKTITETLNETLTPSKKNEPIYNIFNIYGDPTIMKKFLEIKDNNSYLQQLRQNIDVSVYSLNDKNKFLENTIDKISNINIKDKLDKGDKCGSSQQGGKYYKIKYIKDKGMYLKSKS